MRAKTKDAGLTDEIKIDSAGIIDYHEGEQADPRMRDCAFKHGYKITHLSRPVRTSDFTDFDYIVGMDASNIKALNRMCPPSSTAKILLMSSFCKSHTASSVPDPYYGGPDGFKLVIELLEDACDGLLEKITSNG